MPLSIHEAGVKLSSPIKRERQRLASGPVKAHHYSALAQGRSLPGMSCAKSRPKEHNRG